MNADDLTPIEKVQFLELKAKQCGDLAAHVKWVAQTIHQAYHTDNPGTFLVCPRTVCKSSAIILFEVCQPPISQGGTREEKT